MLSSPAEEIMANTTVENELRGLEEKYWQAMKDGDVDAAVEMTDFPCLVTGPQGIGRVDKPTYIKMMKEMPYEIRSVDLKDVQVRVVSDDVAVVAYKIHEELTVDGKPLTLDAVDASTWIRRDGKWTCALHSESLIGDPFGRDQKKTSSKA
jgi:ketosteroid isomerase-like protein